MQYDSFGDSDMVFPREQKLLSAASRVSVSVEEHGVSVSVIEHVSVQGTWEICQWGTWVLGYTAITAIKGVCPFNISPGNCHLVADAQGFVNPQLKLGGRELLLLAGCFSWLYCPIASLDYPSSLVLYLTESLP